MYKKSSKNVLKYFLQLLLLTFPVVTIVNVIMMIVHQNIYPILPFASGISIFLTWFAVFMRWYVLLIPCALICILFFVSFLGVKNKKDQALTYLQYYAIIEVFFLKNIFTTSVYTVLCIMLLLRKKYLYTNED